VAQFLRAVPARWPLAACGKPQVAYAYTV